MSSIFFGRKLAQGVSEFIVWRNAFFFLLFFTIIHVKGGDKEEACTSFVGRNVSAASLALFVAREAHVFFFVSSTR